MLISKIKHKYETLIDETYTGYFSDARLTDIFRTALNSVIESKLVFEGSSDKIDDELTPLRRSHTFTSDPSLSSISFKKLGSLIVDYGQGPRPATPVKSTEIGSIYSSGTQRYPKYLLINDASTLKLTVSPAGYQTASLIYYKAPLVTDGTDIDFTVADYNLVYTDKLTDLIIMESIKQSAIIIREQELLISEQSNIQLNP